MRDLDADRADRADRAEEHGSKRVGIVSRACAMIECFSGSSRNASLAELSARLSLPKPTAFRIATVLTRLKLLDQNQATGTYMLGFAGLRYADALSESIRIRAAARPIMEELRDDLNETIVLSIREGDFRYNVDSVESTQAIGQAQRFGMAIPLYAGAAGRVLLAGLAAAEFESYLSRIQPIAFSDSTITDLNELRAAVDEVRRVGFATTSGEYTPGSHAVACRIDAPPDYETAALHVSIPRPRRTKAFENRTVQTLQTAVHKIARALAERR